MSRLICLLTRHAWDRDPGDIVLRCTRCGRMLDLRDIGIVADDDH